MMKQLNIQQWHNVIYANETARILWDVEWLPTATNLLTQPPTPILQVYNLKNQPDVDWATCQRWESVLVNSSRQVLDEDKNALRSVPFHDTSTWCWPRQKAATALPWADALKATLLEKFAQVPDSIHPFPVTSSSSTSIGQCRRQRWRWRITISGRTAACVHELAISTPCTAGTTSLEPI